MPKLKAIGAQVPSLPVILSMEEIQKLNLKDACARFAERAAISQRAFAEMGKLHHSISRRLKTGQTIYGELRKLGVKDSTISNASYASRVFDMVAGGHLPEAQFDTFTFADCLAICRVTGDRSKRRLSAEEVVTVIAAKPETFDAEFQSIYETGLTVEEVEAQAKAEAERQAAAAAEQARLAEEGRKAEEQRKADEAAAEVQRAEEAAKFQHQAPPPAAPTPAPAPISIASAPVEGSPEPAQPEHAAEAPAPSNIHQMPASPDAALPEILAGLETVMAAASALSVEAKKEVFAKLNDLLGALGDQITGSLAAAA